MYNQIYRDLVSADMDATSNAGGIEDAGSSAILKSGSDNSDNSSSADLKKHPIRDFFKKHNVKDIIQQSKSAKDQFGNIKTPQVVIDTNTSTNSDLPVPFYQRPITYIIGVPILILLIWGATKMFKSGPAAVVAPPAVA